MKRSIEELLIQWKDGKERRPLILRGARQVGKSYVVEKFGRAHFESFVVINFELQPLLIPYFDDLDPASIIPKLETALNVSIIPGKTLLFFDEIQNCPKALMALRYFKEKMALLHVIAAGSLLEFTLQEANFSFPVGRVEFMYMKPLSFYEYLEAIGKSSFIEHLRHIQIEEGKTSFIHEQLTQHLREYFLIGGMPAAINAFLQSRSFLDTQRTLNSLLETYRTDFTKYASKTEHKYLQLFFEKAPGVIGKQFKYSHIATDVRSRELKTAFEQLTWAGLLSKVSATSASGIPLQTHVKEHLLKILFLDIGLLNCALKLDLTPIWNDNLHHLNTGISAEQFVGQELIAYADPFVQPHLFYWEREKTGSTAEVDYVIQSGTQIIPIEVKAGKTGRLRSLLQFMTEKSSPLGVRIAHQPLSFQDGILSVPFYLIGELPRLINAALRCSTKAS